MMNRPINVLIVGNNDTGKKYLCTVFIEEKSIFELRIENGAYSVPTYIPCVKRIEVDGKMVPLFVQTLSVSKDTLTAYDTLSYLTHSNADVVLICFSIGKPDTLRSIIEDCLPLVKLHCPRAPIVLVGTGMDSRPLYQETNDAVSTPQGILVAGRIGAYEYVECSAYSDDGVFDVFETAVRAVFDSDVMESIHQGMSDLTLTGPDCAGMA